MTLEEIQNACFKLLTDGREVNATSLVGLIISVLQEWGIAISWHPCKGWTLGGGYYYSTNLQASFLRQAIILGKWEAPKVKEEELIYLRGHDGKIMIWPSEGYPLEEYIKVGGWERVRVSPWEEAK